MDKANVFKRKGYSFLFAGVRFFIAGIITLTICRLFKLDEHILSIDKFKIQYIN